VKVKGKVKGEEGERRVRVKGKVKGEEGKETVKGKGEEHARLTGPGATWLLIS
jgi:hypothetical protein